MRPQGAVYGPLFAFHSITNILRDNVRRLPRRARGRSIRGLRMSASDPLEASHLVSDIQPNNARTTPDRCPMCRSIVIGLLAAALLPVGASAQNCEPGSVAVQ